MKRVVAYILVAAMVVSTVPVGFASAAENGTTEPKNSTVVSTEELGYKAEAAGTIIDSPVSSFAVPDEIDIIENSMGSYEDVWEYDEEAGADVTTGEKWFAYNVVELFDNVGFTVQFKNGDTQVLKSLYDSIEYNGTSYSIDYSYNQSSDEPWKVGESYPVTFSILGVKQTTMVNIVENPIESIVVETVDLQENTVGHWDEPEEGDKWFYYSTEPVWRNISITLEDNSTQEVTNRYYEENDEEDEEEEGEEGEEGYRFQYRGFSYPIEFEDTQYEIHWIVGSENVAKVSIAGYEKEFNVTIAGSPVTEFIVPEEICVIQHTKGSYEDVWEYDEEAGADVTTGEKWYAYEIYEIFSNAEFTVQLGDEAPQTLNSIYDEVNYNGKSYPITFSSGQNSRNPWETGGSYPVTFSILGVEATTMVNIIDSPIDDIEVESKKILKNTNGDWIETEDGEWFDYDTSDVMNKATVTFKEEFDLEPVIIGRLGEDYDSEPYITFDGQRYYVSITDNQSYANQWTVGSDNTAIIRVAGFEKNFPVTIVDTPIESIDVEAVTIIEGTKQCTVYDTVYGDDSEEGREIEYTKYDENYWNPAYTVTMKDDCEIDGKKELHFEGGEGFYYNGEAYYPQISSNQSYDNKWDEPGGYTATFSLMGYSTEFTVNIEECNVTSITINDGKPLQLAANIDGFMKNDEEYQFFWYDIKRALKDYTVEIDGKTYHSSEDGDIKYQGDWYNPTIDSNQSYEKQWIAGNTYKAEFTIFGKTEEFEVEIVDTVVGDITVNENKVVELIANIDGEVYEDEYIDEGGDESEFVSQSYFHYYESAMVKSYSVVVNGTTYESDNDGYITINGKKYEPDITTSQSYDKQWIAGKTYKARFRILGETVEFPVKIVDTPVDEIIINNGETIELIANTDGYLDYDEENGEGSYFHYNEYRMVRDCAVKIDGKTYRLSPEYDGIYYNGRYYDYSLDSKQSYKEAWEAGKTYEVEFSTMGKTVTFPVKVVTVPIGKITINGQEEPSLKLIENTYGEWTRDDEDGPKYYYYFIEDIIDKVSVVIDGKTYECDKYGDIEYNGNRYYYELSTRQSLDTAWQSGQTYDVDFTFMGKTTTIKVEILENPIESIAVQDMTISSLSNGYYDYETDNEVKWYRYDFNRHSPAYTLTMKAGFADDGNAVVNVGPGEAFVYEGVSYYPDFDTEQSYENQWTTESPNQVYVDLGGVTTSFAVTLTEELPFTVEFKDVTIVEKTNGIYLYEDIDKYEYFIENEDYVVKDKDGNVLSVEKTDSGMDGAGFNYDGVYYPIYFSSNQNDEPFEKGKDNIVTCKIGTHEFYYNLILKDSKVSSVKINDLTIEESANGKYSLWDYDIAIVVTVDGVTRVVHTNNETYGFKHNDDWYDIDYFDYEYNYKKDEWNGWNLGSNEASVIIGGVKTDFNVHVVCADKLHNYDEGVVTVSPTCKTEGSKTFTCKDCGATKIESISKTSHKMTYHKAVASTCTAAGNVAYYACSVCKVNFADAEGKTSLSSIVDPADGHKPGTAQVTVKATTTKNGKLETKCTVCSTVLETATIKKASKVTLSTDAYTYNGKTKSPKIYVKDSAGKTISSKYYTVTKPSGRKAIGKYTYTIKFKGNYSGTKKLTLTIKPVKPTIQTPKAAKKAITVKWKKGSKSQVTGYQVMVATNSKFTKNKKTATVKGYSKTSYKMTKLKAKTKYYVKVRFYKKTKSGTIYSDWSKVKTIKTK